MGSNNEFEFTERDLIINDSKNKNKKKKEKKNNNKKKKEKGKFNSVPYYTDEDLINLKNYEQKYNGWKKEIFNSEGPYVQLMDFQTAWYTCAKKKDLILNDPNKLEKNKKTNGNDFKTVSSSEKELKTTIEVEKEKVRNEKIKIIKENVKIKRDLENDINSEEQEFKHESVYPDIYEKEYINNRKKLEKIVNYNQKKLKLGDKDLYDKVEKKKDLEVVGAQLELLRQDLLLMDKDYNNLFEKEFKKEEKKIIKALNEEVNTEGLSGEQKEQIINNINNDAKFSVNDQLVSNNVFLKNKKVFSQYKNNELKLYRRLKEKENDLDMDVNKFDNLSQYINSQSWNKKSELILNCKLNEDSQSQRIRNTYRINNNYDSIFFLNDKYINNQNDNPKNKLKSYKKDIYFDPLKKKYNRMKTIDEINYDSEEMKDKSIDSNMNISKFEDEPNFGNHSYEEKEDEKFKEMTDDQINFKFININKYNYKNYENLNDEEKDYFQPFANKYQGRLEHFNVLGWSLIRRKFFRLLKQRGDFKYKCGLVFKIISDIIKRKNRKIYLNLTFAIKLQKIRMDRDIKYKTINSEDSMNSIDVKQSSKTIENEFRFNENKRRILRINKRLKNMIYEAKFKRKNSLNSHSEDNDNNNLDLSDTIHNMSEFSNEEQIKEECISKKLKSNYVFDTFNNNIIEIKNNKNIQDVKSERVPIYNPVKLEKIEEQNEYEEVELKSDLFIQSMKSIFIKPTIKIYSNLEFEITNNFCVCDEFKVDNVVSINLLRTKINKIRVLEVKRSLFIPAQKSNFVYKKKNLGLLYKDYNINKNKKLYFKGNPKSRLVLKKQYVHLTISKDERFEMHEDEEKVANEQSEILIDENESNIKENVNTDLEKEKTINNNDNDDEIEEQIIDLDTTKYINSVTLYLREILNFMNIKADELILYYNKNKNYLLNYWLSNRLHYCCKGKLYFCHHYYKIPFNMNAVIIVNSGFIMFIFETYLLIKYGQMNLNNIRNKFLSTPRNVEDYDPVLKRLFYDRNFVQVIENPDRVYEKYNELLNEDIEKEYYKNIPPDIILDFEEATNKKKKYRREEITNNCKNENDNLNERKDEKENKEKNKIKQKQNSEQENNLKEKYLDDLEALIVCDKDIKLNDKELNDIRYLLSKNTLKYLEKLTKEENKKLLFSIVYKNFSKINKHLKYQGKYFSSEVKNDFVPNSKNRYKKYFKNKDKNNKNKRNNKTTKKIITKTQNKDDQYKEQRKDVKFNNYNESDKPILTNETNKLNIFLDCSWGTKILLRVENKLKIEEFDKAVKKRMLITDKSRNFKYYYNSTELSHVVYLKENDVIKVVEMGELRGGSEQNNVESSQIGTGADNLKTVPENETNLLPNINDNNDNKQKVIVDEKNMKKQEWDKMQLDYLYYVDNYSNIINSLKSKSTAYVDSINPQKTLESRMFIGGESLIADCLEKILTLEHGNYKRSNLQARTAGWQDSNLAFYFYPNTIDFYVAGYKAFNRVIQIENDYTPLDRYYYGRNTVPQYEVAKIRAWPRAITQTLQDDGAIDEHEANYFNVNNNICSIYDGAGINGPCIRFKMYTMCRQSDQYSCTRLANFFSSFNRDSKFADELTRALKLRRSRLTNNLIQNLLEDIFSDNTLVPMKYNHDIFVLKIVLYLLQSVSMEDLHGFNSHDSFNIVKETVRPRYEIRRNIFLNEVPTVSWCTYTQFLRFKYGEVDRGDFYPPCANTEWWFVPVRNDDIFSPNNLYWNILCRLPYPQFVMYGFGLAMRWNQAGNNFHNFHDNAVWLNPLANNVLISGHQHICFVIIDDVGIVVDPQLVTYAPVQFFYNHAGVRTTYEAPNLFFGPRDANNFANLDVGLMDMFVYMKESVNINIFNYLNLFLKFKGWSISEDLFKMATQLVLRSKQSFKRLGGAVADMPEWPINPNGMVWSYPGSENCTLGYLEEPNFYQEMYLLLNILRPNEENIYLFNTWNDVSNIFKYWKYSYSAICSENMKDKVVPIAILNDQSARNTNMHKSFLDSMNSCAYNKMTFLITDRTGFYDYIYYTINELFPIDQSPCFHNDFDYWKRVCIKHEFKDNYKNLEIINLPIDNYFKLGFAVMKNVRDAYQFLYDGNKYISEQRRIYNEIIYPTIKFIQFDDRPWWIVPLSYDYPILQNNPPSQFCVPVIFINPLTFERDDVNEFCLIIDNEPLHLNLISDSFTPNLIDNACLLWTYRLPIESNPMSMIYFAVDDRDTANIYLADNRVQKWEFSYSKNLSSEEKKEN